MRWLHGIVIALGAALFLGLIAKIGPAAIVEDSRRVGWALVPIVLLSGLEHFLHALGWERCFDPRHRPSRWSIFGAHLAGNAISFVTPTATIGGEIVRAALMPRAFGSKAVVAVLTIDRLAWSVADAILALAGVVVLVVLAPLSNAARGSLFFGLALIVAGICGFLVLQRKGRVISILTGNRLVRRFGGAAFAERLASGGREIDGLIREFHDKRPRDFLVSIAIHFAGTCMGAAQLACFLKAMDFPVSAQSVFPLFLVGTAVDLVAFFVPARLGVQEGSRMLATTLSGLGAEPGLLFSLVLRFEQVIWCGLGLALYGVMLRRRRRTGSGGEPETGIAPEVAAPNLQGFGRG